MDWLADLICRNICSHSTIMKLVVCLLYAAATSNQTPCITNGWQIIFRQQLLAPLFRFVSSARRLAWHLEEVRQPFSSLNSPPSNASRLQQQWAALYQSASASIPASATCPTLSASEHISWAGQESVARFSYWLTEGFLHGSLCTRIAGCLRSHYGGCSGCYVVSGGLFDTSGWAWGVFNYILSSGIM